MHSIRFLVDSGDSTEKSQKFTAERRDTQVFLCVLRALCGKKTFFQCSLLEVYPEKILGKIHFFILLCIFCGNYTKIMVNQGRSANENGHPNKSL
ncbi:hypothetical protein MNBD_CHLOROFLEXI01-2973, partial [hydrothermal vent metagenome]